VSWGTELSGGQGVSRNRRVSRRGYISSSFCKVTSPLISRCQPILLVTEVTNGEPFAMVPRLRVKYPESTAYCNR